MKIYIDQDFKCHTSLSEGMTEIETPFFDGKCNTYIEGYRFVPSGQTWVRPDGTNLTGEMAIPWKPWTELDQVQRLYEQEQYEKLSQQNQELLGIIANQIEVIYQEDVKIINQQ